MWALESLKTTWQDTAFASNFYVYDCVVPVQVQRAVLNVLEVTGGKVEGKDDDWENLLFALGFFNGERARQNCVNGLILEIPDLLGVMDRRYNELWNMKSGGKFVCAKKDDLKMESQLLEKAQGFRYFCDEGDGEGIGEGEGVGDRLKGLLGGEKKNYDTLKKVFESGASGVKLTKNSIMVAAVETKRSLLSIERSIYAEKERMKKAQILVDGGGSGSSYDGELKMKVIGLGGQESKFVVFNEVDKIWLPVDGLDDVILPEILHGEEKSLEDVWKTCVNKANRLAGYLADEGVLTWERFVGQVEEFLYVYGGRGSGLGFVEIRNSE